MYMQAVLIRAAILLVMCLGLSIAMTHHNPAQASRPQALVSVVSSGGPVAAAQAPVVVLPTIHVRPSAAEIEAALNIGTEELDVTQDQPIFNTAVSLRSLRLDMPYYSFGKALSRVSKE